MNRLRRASSVIAVQQKCFQEGLTFAVLDGFHLTFGKAREGREAMEKLSGLAEAEGCSNEIAGRQA